MTSSSSSSVKNPGKVAESTPNQSNLLISFCNQTSSPDFSLGIFEPASKTSRWIDFSGLDDEYRNGIAGVCGIARVGENFIVATQGASPILAIIDIAEAKISQQFALHKCRDPHSIVCSGGYVYLTSTGTNEIYRIYLDENQFGEEELFWSYPEVSYEQDEIHLNGLTVDNGNLIASCFGPRNAEGSWDSEGRVFYVESGRTVIDALRQPHSPIVSNDRLLVAESAAFKVRVYRKTADTRWDPERVISLSGYARGLALSGDELVVGISASRELSRSQGKFLYAKQSEPMDSKLVAVDLRTGDTSWFLDILLYGREPYDLCAIDHQADLLSETESLRSRIRNMEYWVARNAADMGMMHDQLNSLEAVDSELVSVIIPTYDRAIYLGDSIRSVLAQTYSNLELIVVDDGSTDDTEAIVGEFQDPRLRYVRQPNRGRSNARNHALSLASGKFITFLDSDDLYLPDKIRLQVNYLKTHPATGMVYTCAHCIDEQGEMLSHQYQASVSGLIYESIAFFTPVTITLPTVMTYREVLDKVGNFDEKMHRFEDTDMWRRISKYCRIDAMQEYTCLLRTHEDNSLLNQKPDVIAAALDYYAAKILEEDAEVKIQVRRTGLSNLYRYYGHAFLSVPAFSAKGRKLMEISRSYDSALSVPFPRNSVHGRIFWSLYTRSRLGVFVDWTTNWLRRIARFVYPRARFVYAHMLNFAYQIFSKIRRLVFKR